MKFSFLTATYFDDINVDEKKDQFGFLKLLYILGIAIKWPILSFVRFHIDLFKI